MSTTPNWKDRLRYALDNQFSRGPATLILWLGGLSVIVVTIAALVVWLTGFAPEGETAMGFGEAFWRSLMRTLDAGTMGGDTGWGFRLVMLLVTVGGIFVISTFIGVLTTGLDGRLEDLRKGRSRVLEQNHTVILGWSEQVFTIVSELMTANENQKSACIVVMGDKDKVEMQDQIAGKVTLTGKTRLVCRSGRPMEMADLSLVSLNTARSIVVVSPESDDPDSEVIKTILAITNHPDRRDQPYRIVAELRNPKNRDVAAIVGHGEVEWVLVGDLVARVIAQTCRQSGLSVAYTELLDFGGDELYFTPAAPLANLTYGEALFHFEHNAVMGIVSPGQPARLNPPMDTRLTDQDQLVVMAADDDQIFLSDRQDFPVQVNHLVTAAPHAPRPERTVLLGWNWRAPTILRELNNYVAPGSQAVVTADLDGVEDTLRWCGAELDRLQVSFTRGDTTDRRVLDSLNLAECDHVILLCYSDDLTIQQADARTLITLLHLRDIREKSRAHFSIVSEMLDIRNRNLAEITQADDFIVSDKLVSLMLAQVSENPRLNAVFADLFDPEGSEIYLKPAGDYVRLGVPVNFYTLLEAARRRGETAIGYRLTVESHDGSRSYGVHLNPLKADPFILNEADRVIVLAEN